MKLNYVYADPTGNITLLVTDSVNEARYGELSKALLSLEPAAEQVGFIKEPECGGDIFLHMAGGEFCGNASLSTAALALLREGRASGTVNTEVFGITGALKADLTASSPGEYTGSIEMPLPASLSERRFSYNDLSLTLPVVEMPGISHIIYLGEPFEGAQEAVQAWCDELGAPALGIMFLSRGMSCLTPLVYVSSLKSLFWERSCASGTCSAAFWLSRNSSVPLRFDFSEPGGILSAEACAASLKLIGRVKLEMKSADINL